MSAAVNVWLWGTRIGTVALADGSEVALFEYDPDFLRSGIEVAPLTMPLGGQVFSFPALPRNTFRGLPGLLADSLPDKFGNAVINRWLDAQQRPRESFSALDRLCYTGKRGMGALEFEPALGPDASAAQRIEVDELVELASEVLSQREAAQASASDASMSQILQVGTSAGGARAKAIVAWNEDADEIRSGQVDAGPGFGYWVMKLDGVTGNGDKEGADPLGYTNVEYAYHLMARAAGIEMTECRLFEEGGRSHFMTRRFDRVGDPARKLHMLSLGGMAHLDFNDAGASSYEQAVNVMRRLGCGQDEVEQLFRRMTLNILACNHDDHVKNISFLMDKAGVWRLAPAYDVTYAYNPSGAWTRRHQMSANGKLEGFTRDDLMQVARHMSMSAARARTALSDVVDAVASWPDFAGKANVPDAMAEAIGVAHRAVSHDLRA